MPLPPPEAIDKVVRVLRLARAENRELGASFDEVHALLWKFLRNVGTTAVQTAVTTGISAAVGTPTVTITFGSVAGVGLAMAIMPIGQAIAPWLGAAVIASKAEGIWGFHDLLAHARQSGPMHYGCSCGHCAKALQYLIDKKEANVAIFAVSIFTAGIPLMIDKINSARKHFQADRPKERHARQFAASAREGCVSAMATILYSCGKWPKDKPPDKKLIIEAIAIVLAEDGWLRLKHKW